MRRTIAVWLLIALAESINGTIRTLYLVPKLGAERAHTIGFTLALILILTIATATSRWMRSSNYWTAGLTWVALMLSFEVLLGRLQSMSWERILSEYNPLTGGVMLYGMMWLALAPRLGAYLSGVSRNKV